LIFNSNGYKKPWDGTYNGKEMPVGTYYYIVDPNNGRPRMSGYVVILK
jgi:gliding motility-associated-like protein